MFAQHEVGGEIVGGPAVEQRGNRRAELVEKSAEFKALLRTYSGTSAMPPQLTSGVIPLFDFPAGSLGGERLETDQVRPMKITAQPRCASCTSLCSVQRGEALCPVQQFLVVGDTQSEQRVSA